jgi:hypothetical protein
MQRASLPTFMMQKAESVQGSKGDIPQVDPSSQQKGLPSVSTPQPQKLEGPLLPHGVKPPRQLPEFPALQDPGSFPFFTGFVTGFGTGPIIPRWRSLLWGSAGGKAEAPILAAVACHEQRGKKSQC